MAQAPEAKKARLDSDAGACSAKGGAEGWDHDCQSTVRFRLVQATGAEEMEREISAGGVEFDAEYFHQHFGEGERIRGYRDLRVSLWMSSQTYHTWLDVSYSKKKLGADKIERVFKEGFPLGYVKSKEEFIQAVTGAAKSWPDLSQMGEHMATIPLKGEAKVFIKRFNLATCPQEVQELHGRFEPLLLFFIDGAQIIEKGDPKWDVLLLIQPTPLGNQLLGITTMYNFWAYPDSIRLRLSQILVLPPFQGFGLGKRMVQATYDIARARECIDLTIEDPTPNLQCVREKLELEQLLAAPWAAQMAADCARSCTQGAGAGPSRSGGGVSKAAEERGQQAAPPAAFVARAQRELRIYRKEAQLVWEALLFVQPGMWPNPRGRAALEALVAARLEESQFSYSSTVSAERKRLVQMRGDDRNFIVMRVAGEPAQGAAGPSASSGGGAAGPPAAAAAAAAGGGASGSEECVAQGRLSIVTTTKAEKATQLREMVAARIEALETIQRLLGQQGQAGATAA